MNLSENKPLIVLVVAGILILIFLLFTTVNKDIRYTLLVLHPEKGEVKIDDKPLDKLTRNKVKFSKERQLYFLNILNGKHKLNIKYTNGNVLDTAFVLETGEAFMFIDLETGNLSGFD